MLFEERLGLLEQHIKTQKAACSEKDYGRNVLVNLEGQTALLRKLAQQTDVEFVSTEGDSRGAEITHFTRHPNPDKLSNADMRSLANERYKDVCKYIRGEHYDDGEKASLASAIGAFMQRVKNEPMMDKRIQDFQCLESYDNMRR